MIGLALPIVMGMIALGTEIAFLLYKQRQMQSAADSAAFGAATALQTGHPTPLIEARGTAASYNFVDGANGATVTVNTPPLSGSQTGVTGAVEVIIQQPQKLSIARLFTRQSYNVTARAVAKLGSGSYCVLQLDTTSNPGFTMNNGASATLTNCGLAINSTGSSAFTMTGGTKLTTPAISVAGTASVTNGSSVDPSNALKTGQANVADPYGSVARPSFSGCAFTGKSYGWGNSVQTLTPAVYCNGLSIGNGANILFSPGVYFIDRGSFALGGGATINGTGVTIVLTSSTGSNHATMTIANGVNVTMTAPTSGATAGILMFGDRSAPKTNSNDVGGGAIVSFNGALYFPSQKLLFENGSSNAAGCTQLIAGTLQLTGGSRLQNTCPAGVVAIGGGGTRIVE